MGFKFIGIEFEKTSLRQILEALAIFQWSVIFGYGGIVVSLILFVLLFTPFAVVSLALWAWMIYDYRTPERGGRRWEWVRDWKVWKLCRDYFPVSLIPTAKLDPARNYLLVYHPHGILSYGAFANFGTNANDFSKLFPGLRATILGLKIQFLCPLIRDYFMAFGKHYCFVTYVTPQYLRVTMHACCNVWSICKSSAWFLSINVCIQNKKRFCAIL
jgi:hypothetical protein